jgi:hypothetical protein
MQKVGSTFLRSCKPTQVSVSFYLLNTNIVFKSPNFLLVDDFRIVFERQCPFKIALVDPEVLLRVGDEARSEEDIVVKILIRVKSN